MKIIGFWKVTPYNLVETCRHFGGTCYLYISPPCSRVRLSGIFLAEYTSSLPIRQQSSYLSYWKPQTLHSILCSLLYLQLFYLDDGVSSFHPKPWRLLTKLSTVTSHTHRGENIKSHTLTKHPFINTYQYKATIYLLLIRLGTVLN
jgi:hypothetical protein